MTYIKDIKEILLQARQKTYQAINSAMVEAYWNIGKKIVLEEQNGKERASYGSEIIKNLSNFLKINKGLQYLVYFFFHCHNLLQKLESYY